jgi:Cytosine specific DNA methyltransferase replication foci domain
MEPAKGEDPRATLRSMWQLPATWRILRLLALPLSHAPPSPDRFEDALADPAAHASVVANLHGRLLGIAAGKSSENRWIQMAGRFCRNFPGTFGMILGIVDLPGARSQMNGTGTADAETVDGDDGEIQKRIDASESDGGEAATAAAGAEEDDVPLPPKMFKTAEEYAALSPSVRLLFLYAMAELVICEHDTLLQAGNLADVPSEEMRLEPVGYDALGSAYWYFGDELRLFREPDQRKARAREARAREETRFDAEQKAAKAAEMAKKEREMQKAQSRRAKAEKWAPRVAATRSTRASRAKEAELLRNESDESDANMSNGVGMEEGDVVSQPSTSLGRRTSARRSSAIVADTATDSGHESAGAVRTSLRKRQLVQAMPPLVTASSPATKRRRSTSVPVDFDDPDLRRCYEWELVCSGPEELSTFLQRFGAVKDIRHPRERVLVRRLGEELLPILEEVQDKIAHENERRLRAEMLTANMKKSSRVEALERRREEAEAAAAAAELEAAAAENAAAERQAWIHGHVERQELILSKELRLARRDLARVQEFALASASKSRPAPSRRGRGSLRDRRRTPELVDACNPEAVGDEPANVANAFEPIVSSLENSVSAGTIEPAAKREATLLRPVAAAGANVHVCKAEDVAVHERKGEERTDVKMEDVVENEDADARAPTAEVAKSLDDAEVDERELSRPVIPSALLESKLPDEMTWQFLQDEQLPTRLLTGFLFCRRHSLSLATLEDLLVAENSPEEDNPTVMGFGIVVPPHNVEAPPVLVELEHVLEWQIEYARQPRLWVKTTSAWYELQNALPEYGNTFNGARSKYEICVRLSILASSMKWEQLTYDTVCDLLSGRYFDMRAYKESDILENAPFILEQVGMLGKAALLKCGFIKTLRKREGDAAKAEERAAQRQTRGAEKAQQLEARRKQRELEKERAAEYRLRLAREKARKAVELKLNRARPHPGNGIVSHAPIVASDALAAAFSKAERPAATTLSMSAIAKDTVAELNRPPSATVKAADTSVKSEIQSRLIEERDCGDAVVKRPSENGVSSNGQCVDPTVAAPAVSPEVVLEAREQLDSSGPSDTNWGNSSEKAGEVHRQDSHRPHVVHTVTEKAVEDKPSALSAAVVGEALPTSSGRNVR